MILVDTSVWIEFFRANPQFFSTVQFEVENRNILTAECVFAELLQGARNKRESDLITHYWINLPKRDETGLWIEAGTYAARHKLSSKGVGLIDAFLLVFARKFKATLWTLDKKLKSLLEPSEIFLGH